MKHHRTRLGVGVATVLAASLLAAPSAGAELPTPPTEHARPLEAVPNTRTGVPQLFDESRPVGLSLNSAGAAGTTRATAADASRSGSLPNGPQNVAWSTDCDADRSTAKPYCQEPTGQYWVHGNIRHQRWEWVVEPGSEEHPQAPQFETADVDYAGFFPAREVLVRVADGCGLHADGYTDENGDYSIVFPSWCGEKTATVTLYSMSTPEDGKRVALGVHTASPDPDGYSDLIDDPALYTVVAGEVGSFNPEAEAKCQDNGICINGKMLDRDFLGDEEGDLFDQGLFPREGEVARALTIMENTMSALDYYRELVDDSRLPQINLVLTEATFPAPEHTAVFRSSQSNLIHIPAWLEWSPFAVVHETSHYFDGGVLVEGGLEYYGRFGEPVANARAAIILGSSWMVPSAEPGAAENLDVQGNWSDEAGEVVAPESLSMDSPGMGYAWRILWDLHDGTGPEPIDFGHGDFDQWDGGGGSASPLSHQLNGVLMEYLPQWDGSVHPDYVDRGLSGPDLVDILDGFACLYGMSQLQMETMFSDVMNYGYDFGHCQDLDDLSPT